MIMYLHDNFFRPLTTNKNFVERFERAIETLLAKTIGCAPYTLFCLELEKYCRDNKHTPPTTQQRQEIFCAIAEWCFIGLNQRIAGICNISYDWDFWEKIGRRLKAGNHSPGNFYKTERIIPSTEVETSTMDAYTHDQFYLPILNDGNASSVIRDLVLRCMPFDNFLASYCATLCNRHNLGSPTTTQRRELSAALADYFVDASRVNYPIPTKEEPIVSNNTPAFQTKHFVDGVDATTLSDDQLINTIKRLEAETRELSAIQSSSKKITAKITELDQQREAVVDLLDARMP